MLLACYRTWKSANLSNQKRNQMGIPTQVRRGRAPALLTRRHRSSGSEFQPAASPLTARAGTRAG